MQALEIKEQLKKIEERNKKVELEKAWEGSLTRRVIIFVFTYIIAGIWLWMISESLFLLKAFVPVAGYILSTLSIPQIKKLWVNSQQH